MSTRVQVMHGRCARLLRQLMDYLDGELTPRQCVVIERHLASCACCGAVDDNVRLVMALCQAEGQVLVPNAVRRRARARIHRLLEAADRRAVARPHGGR